MVKYMYYYFLCLFVIFWINHSNIIEAAPGIAGADWTDEEVELVKEKLWSVMSDPDRFVKIFSGKKKKKKEQCGEACWKDCDAFDKDPTTHPFCPHCDDVPDGGIDQCCTGWCDTKNSMRTIRPSATKFVRLGFHDCLKYQDGSGGCDGCLDFTGVGIMYRTKDAPINGPHTRQFPDSATEMVGNNNLAQTVLALEHIYNDEKILPSKKSLKDLGKSRADLWALAAISAVEFSVNDNNLACQSNTEKYASSKVVKLKGHTCGHHHQNEPDCMVTMPKIPFKTGRKDCIPDDPINKPYIANSNTKEVHPSVDFTGQETAAFFAQNFGFTPKESVALLGAHTLGGLDPRNSMFKYFWTRGEESFLNNQYYKSLVSDKGYALQCNIDSNGDRVPIKVGNSDGSPSQIHWIVAGSKWTTSGGPFSWRRNFDMCFDGGIGSSGVGKLIKKNFTSEDEVYANCWDYESQSTNQIQNGWTCDEKCLTDNDFNDEVMLNVDMGLYLDFEVKKEWAGRQIGCPGFDKYKDDRWNQNKNGFSHGTEAKCNKKGPYAAFVEEYAAKQDLWVEDFGAVYTKMLENVYDSSGNKITLTSGKVYNYCSRNPPSLGKFKCAN